MKIGQFATHKRTGALVKITNIFDNKVIAESNDEPMVIDIREFNDAYMIDSQELSKAATFLKLISKDINFETGLAEFTKQLQESVKIYAENSLKLRLAGSDYVYTDLLEENKDNYKKYELPKNMMELLTTRINEWITPEYVKSKVIPRLAKTTGEIPELPQSKKKKKLKEKNEDSIKNDIAEFTNLLNMVLSAEDIFINAYKALQETVSNENIRIFIDSVNSFKKLNNRLAAANIKQRFVLKGTEDYYNTKRFRTALLQSISAVKDELNTRIEDQEALLTKHSMLIKSKIRLEQIVSPQAIIGLINGVWIRSMLIPAIKDVAINAGIDWDTIIGPESKGIYSHLPENVYAVIKRGNIDPADIDQLYGFASTFNKAIDIIMNTLAPYHQYKDVLTQAISLINSFKGIAFNPEMANIVNKVLDSVVPDNDVNIGISNKVKARLKARITALGDKSVGMGKSIKDILNNLLEDADKKNKVYRSLKENKEFKEISQKFSNLLSVSAPAMKDYINAAMANAPSLSSVLQALVSYSATFEGFLNMTRGTSVAYNPEAAETATEQRGGPASEYYVSQREMEMHKDVDSAEEAIRFLISNARETLIAGLGHADLDTIKSAVQSLKENISNKEYSKEIVDILHSRNLLPKSTLNPVLIEDTQKDINKQFATTIEAAMESMLASLKKSSNLKKLLPANVTIIAGVENLGFGQPVLYNNNLYVIVGATDNNLDMRYIISEEDINTHNRVPLIEANIAELVPVKQYEVAEGDIIEIEPKPVKIIDASAKDLGFVTVAYSAGEPFPMRLASLKLNYSYKKPFKLVKCKYDGSFIFPDDEVNCPNSPENQTKPYVDGDQIVMSYKSSEDTAMIDDELATARDMVLESTKFGDVTITRASGLQSPDIVDDIEDYEGQLEIGAKVKKFASSSTGVILANVKNNVWLIEWDTARREKCWGQELIVIH